VVPQVVLVNTSAEVHLLALAVVIIVATMAIGQEIAKLVIGGTSVIDADSVGTLSATAATAPGQLAVLLFPALALLEDTRDPPVKAFLAVAVAVTAAAAAAATAVHLPGEVAAQSRVIGVLQRTTGVP
jgi:hypothetical protein